MAEKMKIAPARIPFSWRKLVIAGVLSACAPAMTASAHPNEGSSAFVLFSPGSRGAEMSGSMEDVRRANSLRNGGEGLLYVRHGSSAYVIRDAAILRKAKSFFEPEEALGARQTELGSRQTALGQQQSRLGAEQAAISSRLASSSPEEAERLDRQEETLSREEEALGKQQEALGRQQEAIGREQDRLSRVATEQVESLFAEALSSGLARRVD